MSPFFDELERDLVEAARREQRAPVASRRARRWVSTGGARAALAAAAAAVVVVLIAGSLTGGGQDQTAAARLEGSYESPYTSGARFAPERDALRGSELEITVGRFTLYTDAIGVSGSVTVEDGVARFRNDTRYFRRPNFAGGGQELPDPDGRCLRGAGRYRYAVGNGTLRFTLLDDACAPRAKQLTARSWRMRG